MSNGKSEREQRLAEALRANLRRRKGQAREWEQDGADKPGDSGPAPGSDGRDDEPA